MPVTKVSFLTEMCVGGLLVALTGCSASSEAGTASASSAGGASASQTPTATAAGAKPTQSDGSSSCGPNNATTAVQKAMLAIPRPIPSVPSAHWDAPHADVAGYNPCAALSWAVLGIFDGTPSSPNAILLFHDGAFLGTATSTQYPFQPSVTRTSASSIAVTYRYAKPADSNANPSGITHATYTWNDAARKVIMSGSVPPAE